MSFSVPMWMIKATKPKAKPQPKDVVEDSMHLVVFRYNSEADWTNGLLLIDDRFQCHTLEDEHRTKKVWGETRVPDGTYPIYLRTEGGFHTKYSAKFPKMHKGMLWIADVPGFEWILIHIGNDDDDTAGCLLVGNSTEKGKNFVGDSTGAYLDLYPKVLDALQSGRGVDITFITLDKIINNE